jgi:hypothetical protein
VSEHDRQLLLDELARVFLDAALDDLLRDAEAHADKKDDHHHHSTDTRSEAEASDVKKG